VIWECFHQNLTLFILVKERPRNDVEEAYTKQENIKSVNNDLLQLRRNKITSLNQSASLSDKDKKKYPDGLK
jgi:hypothetical protein